MYVFSDVARYCAHGKVIDARLWVPGEGPEAVHGRLWQHSQHEQRQSQSNCFMRWRNQKKGNNHFWIHLLSLILVDLPLSASERTCLLSPSPYPPSRSQTAKFAHQWQRRTQGLILFLFSLHFHLFQVVKHVPFPLFGSFFLYFKSFSKAYLNREITQIWRLREVAPKMSRMLATLVFEGKSKNHSWSRSMQIDLLLFSFASLGRFLFLFLFS